MSEPDIKMIGKLLLGVGPTVNKRWSEDWSEWVMDAASSARIYIKSDYGSILGPAGGFTTIGVKTHWGAPRKKMRWPRGVGRTLRFRDTSYTLNSYGTWSSISCKPEDLKDCLDFACASTADLKTRIGRYLARINRKRVAHGLEPLWSIEVQRCDTTEAL